jgi:thymidine phosphorylase
LGAGRSHREQALAHGGGVVVHARLGDRVESGQPLAEVQVGERDVDMGAMLARVGSAFEIGPERVEPPRLVLGTVDEVAEEGAGNREQGTGHG